MMDLWGVECFGVMEPLWGDGSHGMMGMAGCGVMGPWDIAPFGVMELWDVARFGLVGQWNVADAGDDEVVGRCSFLSDGAVGCG